MAKHNTYILRDRIWNKKLMVNVSINDIAAYTGVSNPTCYAAFRNGTLIKHRYEIERYIPELDDVKPKKKGKPSFYRASAAAGYYPRDWSEE